MAVGPMWVACYRIYRYQRIPVGYLTDNLEVICRLSYRKPTDNLQKAAHKLNQIITEYGLTISVQTTKSMAFKGRGPVRTKIVIDKKIIEKVKLFKYLRNMVSYEKKNWTLTTNYKTILKSQVF